MKTIIGKIFHETNPDESMDEAAQMLHDSIVNYIYSCKRAQYGFNDDEIDDMIGNISCKAIQENLHLDKWNKNLIDMDGNQI